MGNQIVSHDEEQMVEERTSFASPPLSSPKMHRYDGTIAPHTASPPVANTRCFELDDVIIGENEDTFHANFIVEYLVQEEDTQSTLCLQFDVHFETIFQYNSFQLPLSSNSILEDPIPMLNSIYIPILQSHRQRNNVQRVYKNFIQKAELLRHQPREDIILQDEWVSLDRAGNLMLPNFFWPNGKSKTISLNNLLYVEKKTLATLRGHCVIPHSFFAHVVLAQHNFHLRNNDTGTPLEIGSEQEYMEQINQTPVLICKERGSYFPILFTCKTTKHCQPLLELAQKWILPQ